MKTEDEMLRVWEVVPKEKKEDKNYVFILSQDWKDVPETFMGKKVYQILPIKLGMMYYMFNPFWDEETYKNTNDEMD